MIKRIPGFQNYYAHSDGYIVNSKGEELKGRLNESGYLYVGLYLNGKMYSKKVSRLILLTFVGPSKLQTNHIDGNKLNDKLSNLEYVTPKENVNHSFDLGLAPLGEDRGTAKLTEEDVKEIRRLYSSMTQRRLAKRFGVVHSTIKDIVNRKTWKHI